MSKADSIKARLRNLAIKNGKPYEYVLTHYFIERVLYRISVSPYAQHFILKGGLLLQAVFDQQARATRDIDLLAEHLNNQTDDLRRIFREVCSIQADDGITFELNSIEADPITQDADYQGVSISFYAFLDRSKGRVHIDVGFGDVVIPSPNSMSYPSLLDSDEIEIRAYSLESVISEKFHAMVDLAFANSRMKDFFDIAMLATKNNFEGYMLQQAIQATFKSRSSDMPDIPAVFTDAFLHDQDKQIQWQAFIKRTKVEQGSFIDVLSLIRYFLQPLYVSLRAGNQWDADWDYLSLAWRPKNSSQATPGQ